MSYERRKEITTHSPVLFSGVSHDTSRKSVNPSFFICLLSHYAIFSSDGVRRNSLIENKIVLIPVLTLFFIHAFIGCTKIPVGVH